MSKLEEDFAFQVKACGLPEPLREFRFHPTRRWRSDFAWPERKILVEIEGGTWTNGRHTTGAGFAKDCEKYNTATEYGWRVFRYTGDDVKTGAAVIQLQRVLT